MFAPRAIGASLWRGSRARREWRDGRQAYAILTQRARNAAATAEPLRAVFGVREEERISRTCLGHEGNLALWRDPWRRNGWARLSPLVGIAA